MKKQTDLKRVSKTKFQLGPTPLSRTNYQPYLSSMAKKQKQILKTLEPFDLMDVPPIEECTEPVDPKPIEVERIKITNLLDSEPENIRNPWKLYLSKAQIISNTNHKWIELEMYLLKLLNKFMTYCAKGKKKIEEYEKNLSNYLTNLHEDQRHLIQDTSYLTNKKKMQTQILNTTNRNKTLAKKYQLSMQNFEIQSFSKINSKKKLKPLQSSENQLTKISNIYQNTTTISKTKGTMDNGSVSNAYLFDISRLQKQNELFKRRINELQNENKQKFAQFKIKIEEEMKIKHSQTQQKKHKYESQLLNKKFHNEVLSRQYKNMQSKYQELESKYLEMKDKYEGIEKQNVKVDQFDQYKELWLMEREEINSLNLTIHKLTIDKANQIKKNMGLKQKLKELSKNYNYSYSSNVDHENDKIDLTNILKEFRDWLKFISVPRISKGMMNNNTFFPEMVCEDKNDYGVSLPKDDQSNYKLLRPNFFIYFEAYEGIIIAEKKFPQRKILPPDFFLTIRAILDAMFLHLTFTTDYKQWLNFPEFVVSYMEKFQINTETWKIKTRKQQIQSEQKINFLLNIFNEQAANSWQCDIFRSFLLENSTLDEIYFYLVCRDCLLKGSQINNNLASADPVCFVKVETAQAVIKEKLKNYDTEMFEKIKSFLDSKKKMKNHNINFIDVNFVLKLLLQVYSIEKIKSEKFFHQSFRGKNPNSKITYTEYSSFMEKNFNFLTRGDISKLYRQIYTLGVGEITYKTIHFVCSMRGLFIPLVRHRFINSNSYAQEDNTKGEKEKEKIFDDMAYLDLMNNVNRMTVNIEEFGQEELLNINVQLNKFLHDHEKLKNYRSLFQVNLLKETERIIKLQAMYRWKSLQILSTYSPITNYEQISKDAQRQNLIHLLSLSHYTDDEVQNLRKARQLRERSIFKLTKNFKIRIKQSMAEFSLMDKQMYETKFKKNQ